jgi:hypothetical protein
MALYLCRWDNGDFSVIQAKNKEDAIEILDEVANAEGLPLYSLTDFMVHFRLTDEGVVELEGFGDQFGDHIREYVHPVLGELDVSPDDATPEDSADQKSGRAGARPAKSKTDSGTRHGTRKASQGSNRHADLHNQPIYPCCSKRGTQQGQAKGQAKLRRK